MKISKPVAKGLAIAGVVGVLGITGGVAYEMVNGGSIRGSPEYRRLEEITEQQGHLAQEYINCTADPAADCSSARAEYLSLNAEAEQITSGQTYMAFVAEEAAIDSRYPFWVAGVAAASLLTIGGISVHERRNREELIAVLEKITTVSGEADKRLQKIKETLGGYADEYSRRADSHSSSPSNKGTNNPRN